MQNKLLPCPICNKEVSIALMGSEEFHYWWMITRGTNKAGNKNCHCRLFMESDKFTDKNGGEEHKKALIEKWNTRKPMERIVEQLENHKNCYEKVIGQVRGVGMLIRSQDKTVIVNLDNIDAIIADGKIKSFNGEPNSMTILGKYSTMEKSIKVLDMICNACRNIAFIDEKSVVFQMPQDDDKCFEE